MKLTETLYFTEVRKVRHIVLMNPIVFWVADFVENNAKAKSKSRAMNDRLRRAGGNL